MNLEIRIDGDGFERELDSLWEWLRREDDLRGRVARPLAEIGPTDLGSTTEIVTVALGSTGSVAAVCRVITVWLQARRSRVRVKLTVTPGGTVVEVDASNLRDVMPVLEHALRAGDVT